MKRAAHNRAEVTLTVLLIIGVLGLGGWGLSKTKFFDKRSKQAETSKETTEELIRSKDEQSANAAASVTKIVEANATAPDSWQKDFIGMEGSLALGFLQKPSPQALIRAEARLRAVAEGERDEARRLYGLESVRASDAEQRAARAIAAKRAADLALIEAAAKERGAEQQSFWFMLLAGAAAILWIYTKISHVSPGALARAVADIRSGSGESDPAIVAIDSVTTPTQQMMTKANFWLNSKVAKIFS